MFASICSSRYPCHNRLRRPEHSRRRDFRYCKSRYSSPHPGNMQSGRASRSRSRTRRRCRTLRWDKRRRMRRNWSRRCSGRRRARHTQPIRRHTKGIVRRCTSTRSRSSRRTRRNSMRRSPGLRTRRCSRPGQARTTSGTGSRLADSAAGCRCSRRMKAARNMRRLAHWSNTTACRNPSCKSLLGSRRP